MLQLTKATNMNFTNLQHIVTSVKLFLAMKTAVKTGLPQYIKNRKGENYLRVTYCRGLSNPFTFFDKKQNDISVAVLSILRTVV